MSIAEPVVIRNRAQLFWAACAGIFVFGIVLAVLGTVFGLPEMRERLDVNLAQQGDVFLMLFFGVFLSTLVVGPVIDHYGNRLVLAASAALVTAALVLFAIAQSFGAAAIAGFLLGFGGGGLNTSTNALVADLYSENRGAMLNLLGTFFGFGALFIPLLAAVISEIFTIPQLLLMVAALSGLCAIAYLMLRFPRPTEKMGFSVLASVKAARIPGALLFAFILFFQSGNESSIGGWVSTYVGSMGESARTATWILAAYWGSLMVGRLLSAQILKWMSKAALILTSAIGSAIGTLVLLSSRSVPMLTAGAVVVGLSYAATYPTVLAMAADRYQRMAGTIFGLLFAIGLLGGMTFPWAIGHISQAQGVRSGMFLPLAGALMIAILISIVRSQETRKT